MSRYTTIELQKESMKFSAAHFTLFSETERENLHGHNYTVSVSLTTQVGDEGLSYDYRYYKKKIHALCKKLNQTTLIPTKSSYLTLSDHDEYLHVTFNDETMIFLNRDITLLDVKNITVEELSNWFVTNLIQDEDVLKKHKINRIQVKVFSGPGQSGSSEWEL